MTRGNFAIAYLQTSISKHPKEVQEKYHTAEFDMNIMGDDGIGKVYPINKADALRMSKKIAAFKKELKTEMMNAAKRYKKE